MCNLTVIGQNLWPSFGIYFCFADVETLDLCLFDVAICHNAYPCTMDRSLGVWKKQKRYMLIGKFTQYFEVRQEMGYFAIDMGLYLEMDYLKFYFTAQLVMDIIQ